MRVFAEILRAAREITAFRETPPAKIDSAETLRAFLDAEIARAAGEMTIKYSQKRLGRGHFTMCKDPAYARELVRCQIGMHAELLADVMHLFASRLHIGGASESWRETMRAVHEKYVSTAPREYEVESRLNESHFNRSGDVRSLSSRTGALLFEFIPLTEGLYSGNKGIFQGQVRALYIRLLQQFDERADKEKLLISLPSGKGRGRGVNS